MKNLISKFVENIKSLSAEKEERGFVARMGNHADQVRVSGRMIYVTNQANGEIHTVVNRRIFNRAGRMVWVGYKGKSEILEVLHPLDEFGVHEDMLPLLPDHEHDYTSQNPAYIYGAQFLPFLILPAGELKVKIYPATILKPDGTGWANVAGVDEYDLSPHQPSTTNEARYVVIQADDDGSISVVVGDAVADRDTLTLADVPLATGHRSHAIILSEPIGVLMRTAQRNDFLDLRFDGRSVITSLSNIDYIDFNTAATYAEVAGRVGWNSDEYTLNIVTGLGPVLQVGQELYTIVHNGTGAQIDNGTAVYPVGASGGFPSVAEADSMTHETINGIILVTTMDIPDEDIGLAATVLGKVRNVDTSAFDLGDTIWVAPNGTGLLNNLTNVKPEFPNYVMQIGGVTVVDGSDGELQLAIDGKPVDTILNFWNGVFRESFDFRVTSDGATITGSLEPTNGHDDMTMIFSDGFTMLDTSPALTIELTPGADDNPQTNYVYIPKSTKVLTVSTSAWPTTVEHIRVAQIFLQSAATTEEEGALRNQNWNDHIEDTSTFQGHLSHIGARLRQFSADWDSGTEGSVVIDGGAVYVKSTAGFVFQMHPQAFPLQDMTQYDIDAVSQGSKTFTISDDGDLSAVFPDGKILSVHGSTGNDGMFTVSGTVFSDPDFVITVLETIPSAVADGTIGDDIHVVNDSGSAYLETTDLADITTDASGDPLNNTSFSIVVWGVANKSGEQTHLMANMPISTYNKNFPENAVADADAASVYTIPKAFKGVGFLIARFTFVNSGGTWSLHETQDLRGFIPNTTAGSGAGGSGISTFLGLTDVPSTYAGQAGYVPVVNAGETDLEWLDIDGRYLAVTGARDAILALSPLVNTFGLATDIDRFYFWDGSSWNSFPIPLGQPSTGVDMGAIPYEDDSGYGVLHLSRKNLHNMVISGFNETIRGAEDGAIKFNVAEEKLQVYINAIWRNILAYSEAEEDAIMLWTDGWQELDAYGKNIIHGNKVDMGAFASDHIVDGGLISDQL